MHQDSLVTKVLVMRSSLLDAKVLADNMPTPTSEIPSLVTLPDTDDWCSKLIELVPIAVERRRRLLAERKLGGAQITGLKREGKILVFEPAISLSDGLAEIETHGFFDVHNCPPSNLWIGLLPIPNDSEQSHEDDFALLTWVPYSSIDSVTRGIDVVAEACLNWIDSERWKHTCLGRLVRDALMRSNDNQ